MRRLTFLAAVVFMLVFTPTALADTVLAGDAQVEPTGNSVPANVARAFSYKALASGTATTMSMWVDSETNAATKIQLGLYSNNAGRPGTLLDSGSTSNVAGDAWNQVTLTGTNVTQGTKYWLVMLGNAQLGYVDRYTSKCTTVRSSAGVTALPASFSSASGSGTRCASLYASGGGSPPPPPVPPSNAGGTASPSISGTPQEGDTLTADPGTWSGDTPMTFAYQWSDGTTGKTDPLGANDVGKNISVTVTATNDAGSASATSQSVGPVQSGSPPPNGKLVSMGWWPAWESDVPLSSAPWNSLTELIAFSMTTSTTAPYLNTTDHSMSPSFSQQFVADAHAHGVTAILSIGGSDDQTWDTACSQANRGQLIQAAIGQMNQFGYDGIELDIEEGPWIGTSDFNGCIQAFHNALKATTTDAGKVPLLTYVEDPTWEDGYMPAVAPYLDQLDVTDYGDTASGVPGVVSGLTSRGVPASKLVIGVGMDQGMTDYNNVPDVVAKAQWLSQNGVLGIGEWTTQDDYYNSGGSWPTFDALASYVG